MEGIRGRRLLGHGCMLCFGVCGGLSSGVLGYGVWCGGALVWLCGVVLMGLGLGFRFGFAGLIMWFG